MLIPLPNTDIYPTTHHKVDSRSIGRHEINSVMFSPKAIEIHGILDRTCKFSAYGVWMNECGDIPQGE